MEAILGVFDPPRQDPPRPWETDGRGLAITREACVALRGGRVRVPALVEEVERVQRQAEEFRDGG